MIVVYEAKSPAGVCIAVITSILRKFPKAKAFVPEADADASNRTLPFASSRHIIMVLGKAQLGHATKVAFQFEYFDKVKAELQDMRRELAGIRLAEVFLYRGSPLLTKRFSHPADAAE
jgi:hypothetical protein